jgi:putative endonuclease
MYFCYILYSPGVDKYYVGHCKAPFSERFRKHLSNHKGFTGMTKDWNAVFIKSFETKEEAYALERVIKSKKSRRYIEWLIENSEPVDQSLVFGD